MEFFGTYAKEIFSAVVVLVIWALNYFVRPRARLIRGVRHIATHVIDEPRADAEGNVAHQSFPVHTASITLVNSGRDTAHNVEITFNWRPQHYHVWPFRNFTEETAPDGRFTIKLASMAPGEFANAELMAVNRNLPEITTARCDECAAKHIPLAPSEIHPTWKLRLVVWFLASGVAANVYVALVLLQKVILSR